MVRLKAFTLVEVVVVIVVLGILSALAVGIGPSVMRNVTGNHTKDQLRSLEFTQLTNSTNRGALMGEDELSRLETKRNFTSEEASGNAVSVSLSSDGQAVGMAALGRDQECFLIKVYSAETNLKSATLGPRVGDCSGDAALEITGEQW